MSTIKVKVCNAVTSVVETKTYDSGLKVGQLLETLNLGVNAQASINGIVVSIEHVLTDGQTLVVTPKNVSGAVLCTTTITCG